MTDPSLGNVSARHIALKMEIARQPGAAKSLLRAVPQNMALHI